MTAKELDTMVNAMNSRYHKVNTRTELTDSVFYLWKGLHAIGREDLAAKLNELYAEIDGIDTMEIVKLGTFDKKISLNEFGKMTGILVTNL